jgi:hypothetical protein
LTFRGFSRLKLDVRTIINADQLRILLNDTRKIMAEQPWLNAMDDHSEPVQIPHGKMEALHKLERNDWVFVPVVRTNAKKGARIIEHGFEVHRREAGWEIITAALEIEANKTGKVHPEAARNHAVQQELEKIRLKAGEPASAAVRQ